MLKFGTKVLINEPEFFQGQVGTVIDYTLDSFHSTKPNGVSVKYLVHFPEDIHKVWIDETYLDLITPV